MCQAPTIGTHGDLRTEIFILVCSPRQCGPNCSIRKLHLSLSSGLAAAEINLIWEQDVSVSTCVCVCVFVHPSSFLGFLGGCLACSFFTYSFTNVAHKAPFSRSASHHKYVKFIHLICCMSHFPLVFQLVFMPHSFCL